MVGERACEGTNRAELEVAVDANDGMSAIGHPHEGAYSAHTGGDPSASRDEVLASVCDGLNPNPLLPELAGRLDPHLLRVERREGLERVAKQVEQLEVALGGLRCRHGGVVFCGAHVYAPVGVCSVSRGIAICGNHCYLSCIYCFNASMSGLALRKFVVEPFLLRIYPIFLALHQLIRKPRHVCAEHLCDALLIRGSLLKQLHQSP